MGFMDDIQNESKKYGGGASGKYYEFVKGANVMRILVKPTVVATHFFGKGNPAVVCVGIDDGCKFHGENDEKPSIKLATYIIDRSDNKVKLAELPLSISYSINNLQEDSDFAFSEFPMPYDIKIKYDPDNKDPKQKYQLTPARQNTELTEDEQKSLADAMKHETPEQYVDKKKARQKDKTTDTKVEYPKDDISPDDIPF